MPWLYCIWPRPFLVSVFILLVFAIWQSPAWCIIPSGQRQECHILSNLYLSKYYLSLKILLSYTALSPLSSLYCSYVTDHLALYYSLIVSLRFNGEQLASWGHNLEKLHSLDQSNLCYCISQILFSETHFPSS